MGWINEYKILRREQAKERLARIKENIIERNEVARLSKMTEEEIRNELYSEVLGMFEPECLKPCKPQAPMCWGCGYDYQVIYGKEHCDLFLIKQEIDGQEDHICPDCYYEAVQIGAIPDENGILENE